MKRYLFFLALCCQMIISSATGVSTQTDSLKQLLPGMPNDTTRLELIQNILRLEQTTPGCLRYAEMLFNEARKQNNPKYAGNALYFQVIYYFNQNELDSVTKKLEMMETYVRKSNLWDYYFDGQRCLIDLYAYREQFEYVINKSLEMHRKAKAARNIRGLIGSQQCLANAFMGTEQWSEAKKALLEAHKLLPQLNNIIVSNSVLSQLITFCKIREEYDGLWKYMGEQRKILQDFIVQNPAMEKALQDLFIFNNIHYAYYYIAKKRPEQVAKYLQKATRYLNENTYFMYRVLYYDANAGYFRLCKDYNQAIANLDSTITLLQGDFNSDYAAQLSIKADVLVEAGRSKEALPIYHRAIELKDSLRKVLSDKQMTQLQSNYHLERRTLEAQQASNRVWLIAFVIILIALLIMSAFTVRIYNVRKALRAAEQATRKATQVAEEANETKNRFLSNMSYNIRIPLNSVVGFSQLIAADDQIDDQTRKEFSGIIQKNSEELMRLVNDVLDLSRLEADMMKFQVQEYDALVLCNEALYMARTQNTEAIGIEFTPEIDSQPLITDPGKLTQVLLSTLVCLQKKTEPRTIRLTLTKDHETHSVRFHITNSPLADPDYSSQEVIIRHEINRLLLAHFNGSYAVDPLAPEGPTIDFTYPMPAISE